MRIYSFSLKCFFLLLWSISITLCYADYKVVGTAECADCNKNNLNIHQAFSGLKATIECKLENGKTKRIGESELNERGQFRVSLPQEIVKENGQELKKNCYAQLHNAAALPCPTENGLEASKLVFKSQHTFATSKSLQFSVTLCSSKFFLPFFNPNHPWFNNYGHPGYNPPQVPTYSPPVVVPQPPESEPLTPPPELEPLPPSPEVEPVPSPADGPSTASPPKGTPPKKPCPKPKPKPKPKPCPCMPIDPPPPPPKNPCPCA